MYYGITETTSIEKFQFKSLFTISVFVILHWYYYYFVTYKSSGYGQKICYEEINKCKRK